MKKDYSVCYKRKSVDKKSKLWNAEVSFLAFDKAWEGATGREDRPYGVAYWRWKRFGRKQPKTILERL